MIWIILIAIVFIIIIAIAKKETKDLNKTPFIDKYHIIIMGLNIALFKGDAELETKDSREHYLLYTSLGKVAYIQFISRRNTLYLKFYEDFMEIKTTFSFYYSGIEKLTDENQQFIVDDFCKRLKQDGRITF